MAFPVVQATNSGSVTSNGTSHSISLPSGVQTGDLLVVIFSSDGAGVLTTFTSGWNKLGQIQASTQATSSVLWKVATGSDSLTITTSASEQSTHLSYRISGATYVSGSAYSGSSTNADPPNHVPPGGAADYLWLIASSHDSTVVATAAPSGYGNLLTQAGGNSSASTSAAYKTGNASSENPGAFTSNTEQWAAWTLAIHPSTPTGFSFGDHFGNSSLDSRWRQFGENNGSVTFGESNGQATIAIPSGTEYQIANEPKLLQYLGAGKGDITIACKLSADLGSGTAYNAVDWIGYAVNDYNYISLRRTFNSSGYTIRLVRINDGGATELVATSTNSSFQAGPVWLKLTRTGTTIRGYYSLNGVDYTEVGTGYSYNQIDPIYVGVGAATSVNNPAFTARVEWFSVDGNEPTDDAPPAGASTGSSTVACTARVRRRFTGAVAGSSVVAGVGSDANSSTFSDNFNNASIDSRWIEQDSIGGATYTEANGVLTISIPSGTNYDNPGEAKLWQDCDNADLVIAAKLTQNWSSASAWQQAGIVIAADNNNFIVLKYQKSSSTTYRLLWGSITGGSWYQIDQLFSQSTDKTPVYIKLTRTGNNFRAYYSDDGSSWTESTQGAYARTLTVSKIGVTAGNYNNAACDAVFDWFSDDGNEPAGSSIGAISSSSTVAATARVRRRFTASIAGTSTVASDLNVRRRFTGSIVGSSLVASTARVKRRFTATIVGSSLIAAVGKVRERFLAAISGTSTVVSSARVKRRFTGTIVGSSLVAASGSASEVKQFSGAIAGASSVSSSIRVRRLTSASISGSSLVASTSRVRRIFEALISGVSSVAALTSVRRRFTGTIQGSSLVAASITSSQVQQFSGAIAGGSSVSATTRVRGRFSATIVTGSVVASLIRVKRKFTGAIATSSSVAATVKNRTRFSGAISGSSTVSCSLSVNSFPQVLATSKGSFNSDSNSHVVTLPSNISAGELLLVVYACDAASVNCTANTGWKRLGGVVANGAASSWIFYKIAAGSDTLTISLSSTQQGSYIAHRISGAVGISVFGDDGSTENADAPIHESPVGSEDILWLAFLATDGTTVASAAPSGYSDLDTQAAGNAEGASVSIARKTRRALTENPGAFTSSAASYAAYTIAVHPTSSNIASVVGFGDHFNDQSEDSRWVRWDINGGATFSEESDGTYKIVIPSGTAYDNRTEARLMQWANLGRDFTIVTKLYGSILGTGTRYIQQGLSWGQNYENYVKFIRQDNAGTERIWAGWVTNNTVNQHLLVNVTNCCSQTIWLKVTCSSGTYTYYYSFNGTDWTQLGGTTYSTPTYIDAEYVGLNVGQWSTGLPGLTAKFDWFSPTGSEPATSEVTGTISGSSTVSCAIRVRKRASGAISGSSQVTSTARVRKRFTGSIVTSSLVTGVARVRKLTLGAIASSSLLAALGRVRRRFTAAIAGSSSVSATTQSTSQFTGVVAGASAVTCQVVVRRRAVGNITSTSTVASSSRVIKRFTGLIEGSSQVRVYGEGVSYGQVIASSLVGCTIRVRQRVNGQVISESQVASTARQYQRFIVYGHTWSTVTITQPAPPVPTYRTRPPLLPARQVYEQYLENVPMPSGGTGQYIVTEQGKKIYVPSNIS